MPNNKVAVNGDLIADGTISARMMAANSVQAGAIQAGAIRTNHIATGEITADRLAIGLGGNLLQNAILANNAHGWNVGAKSSSLTAVVTNTYTKKNGVADWYPNDALDNEVRVKTSVTIATGTNVGWVDPLSRTVFLNAGQWYMFSIYANPYRFQTGTILVEEYSSDGSSFVKSVASSSTPIISGSAQKTIKGMSRYAVKFQCPASGCVSLRFRCSGTTTGANPDVYVARPMLEECTQYTTQPSAWVNSGVTSIHGGSIVTDSITADKIGAGQVTTNHMVAGSIDGKVMRAGTVTADKVVASVSLSSPKISGGAFTGNTFTGGSISGTTITGTNINGNTLSGNAISGGSININGNFIVDGNGNLTANTGTFKGKVYAANLLDDVCQVYEVSPNSEVTIPAFGKSRVLLLLGLTISAFPATEQGSGSGQTHTEAKARIYSSLGGEINGSASSGASLQYEQMSGFFRVPAWQSAKIKYETSTLGRGVTKFPKAMLISIC